MLVDKSLKNSITIPFIEHGTTTSIGEEATTEAVGEENPTTTAGEGPTSARGEISQIGGPFGAY